MQSQHSARIGAPIGDDMHPMPGPNLVPYQFSVRTSRPPAEILDELSTRGVGGIGIDEKGSSYLVLRPHSRYRLTTDMAIGLGIGILIVVLVLTAITPVFVVLLPLGLTPAVPAFFDHRPMLAISAVIDEDGEATRVTVHGQAGLELAAALDAYLGALPAALAVRDAESDHTLPATSPTATMTAREIPD